MEEKKSSRFGGSKVFEIANKFQAKVPQSDEVAPLVKNKQKDCNNHSDILESDSSNVTIMRTESHVMRFNNARALFEKLGEENRSCRDKVQLTKCNSNIDSKGKINVVNDEHNDKKVNKESESSKHKDNFEKYNSNIALSGNVNTSKTNVAKMFDEDEYNIKYSEGCKSNLILKSHKPEKPERKFSSKELIEKQRNWTSHFSKSRGVRYSSDPNKNEVKLLGNNVVQDRVHDNKSAIRSASFSNRAFVLSSPSPTQTDVSRFSVKKKERPVSVIPTTNVNFKDETDALCRNYNFKDILRKEKATSLIAIPLNHDENGSFDTSEVKPSAVESLVSFSPSLGNCTNVEQVTNDTYGSVELTHSDCKLLSTVTKSVLDNEDTYKESLSVTSESLSSLSPPSSPGKVKIENEKQEVEENEKSLCTTALLDEEAVVDFIVYNSLQKSVSEANNLYTISKFEINSISNEKFYYLFRFEKADILTLHGALQMLNKFETIDRHIIGGIEGLCLLLRRFAYPNRWKELQDQFGKHFFALSKLFKVICSFVYTKLGQMLLNFGENVWFTQAILKEFAAVVYEKGLFFHNCIGFIDGTARPICRGGLPNYYQPVRC